MSVWHCSFTCTSDMTHSNVCVTLLIHVYRRHDSSVCQVAQASCAKDVQESFVVSFEGNLLCKRSSSKSAWSHFWKPRWVVNWWVVNWWVVSEPLSSKECQQRPPYPIFKTCGWYSEIHKTWIWLGKKGEFSNQTHILDPHQELLGGGFSTPCPLFCLTCTKKRDNGAPDLLRVLVLNHNAPFCWR